jgi:hypothetical protein
MDFSVTPPPIAVAALEDAETAKISPNFASDRLKLVVLEFAILLDAIDNSAAAAFSPVSDVKKDILFSFNLKF